MLESITLREFKSFRKATLPLAPLTVLIGANASGKSNAIEGLRLLSWLAEGNRLPAIQSQIQRSNQGIRGRIHELGYLEGNRFSLGCQLQNSKLLVDISLGEDHMLRIAGESLLRDSSADALPLYQTDKPAPEENRLSAQCMHGQPGDSSAIIPCDDQMALFVQISSPAIFGQYYNDACSEILNETADLRKYLSGILFLDPSPTQMRDYSFKTETKLGDDGKNISSILYNLWGGNRGDEEIKSSEQDNRKEILEFIRNLPEQHIEAMEFLEAPRGDVMLTLVETFGDEKRTYDATLLSDGTLRVLAIAAAMLSAPEGSMVVIEEVDNGVHPSRAKPLIGQIERLANERNLRVLLSSHNPAMLDALTFSAIPHVVFCYRDPKEGCSQLIRLQDVPEYPGLVAQGGVGYLMTSGIMERFVKEYPGAEEKKRRALEWLDDFYARVDEDVGEEQDSDSEEEQMEGLSVEESQ